MLVDQALTCIVCSHKAADRLQIALRNCAVDLSFTQWHCWHKQAHAHQRKLTWRTEQLVSHLILGSAPSHHRPGDGRVSSCIAANVQPTFNAPELVGLLPLTWSNVLSIGRLLNSCNSRNSFPWNREKILSLARLINITNCLPNCHLSAKQHKDRYLKDEIWLYLRYVMLCAPVCVNLACFFYYPRESFCEGLCNHWRTFVCPAVCLLPR